MSDEPRPKILKSVRLGAANPSRRQLLEAAGAVGAAISLARPGSARASEDTGEMCFVTEVRAFGKAVHAIHPDPGGSRVAAIDDEGTLRIWDLTAPHAPLDTGAIGGVVQVALGSSVVAFVSQGRLRVRDLADPKQDRFSVAGKLMGTLALDEAKDSMLCVEPQGIVRRRLSNGTPTGKPMPLPGSPVDQLLAGDSIWARCGGKLYHWSGSAWEERLSAASMRLDGAGERLAVIDDDKMQILSLPHLKPLYKTFLGGDEPPVFEVWMRSYATAFGDDEILVRGLDQDPAEHRVPSGTSSIKALTGIGQMRGYAWGDGDGRLVVMYRRPSGEIARTALGNPDDATTHTGPASECAEEPTLAGWACVCNTVEVARGDKARSTQTWDRQTATWVQSMQPCDTPIPDGAVCTCNCVSVGSGAVFESLCTCNSVCTCESVGSSYGGSSSYWHPN